MRTDGLSAEDRWRMGRDPDNHHGFIRSHLNLACQLCGRRRRHWLHSEFDRIQRGELRR